MKAKAALLVVVVLAMLGAGACGTQGDAESVSTTVTEEPTGPLTQTEQTYIADVNATLDEVATAWATITESTSETSLTELSAAVTTINAARDRWASTTVSSTRCYLINYSLTTALQDIADASQQVVDARGDGDWGAALASVDDAEGKIDATRSFISDLEDEAAGVDDSADEDIPEPDDSDDYTDDYTDDYEPTLSKAEYKASCNGIAFKRLDRDADQLIGKTYRLTGQVFQIQDAGSGSYWSAFEDLGIMPRTQMLVSVTNEGYGYWSDNVEVLYDGHLSRVFEDDIVTVWGECLGSYTYESVAGYTMTVPAIHALYVKEH